jgi:uncharacterized protein YidB (DUF937 family)
MGLMDDLQNKGMGSLTGGGSNPLATSVLQMIQNHPGGLSGLVQAFQGKGLGDIVSSWVSTGQNLPISADQVTHALGSDQVKQLAASAGISPEAAGGSLAALLPTLIDKLTPNGQVPHQSSLLEMGMNLLKSMGKTGTEG